MEITKKIKAVGLAVLFACSVSVVIEAEAVDIKAEGIQQGNVTFLPTLSVSETYNDNIYLRPGNKEKSSWIGVASPGLGVKVEISKHTLTAGYVGEFGLYHDSSTDDYDDHKFQAGLDLSFSESFGMVVDAMSELGHDNKGSDDINFEENRAPSEFTKNTVGAGVRVGLIDGNRIEAGARYTDLSYENNPISTGVLERSDTELEASLFWNVMPKTAILVGTTYTDIGYDEVTARTLDSQNIFYFVGLDWKATAKTEGNIKLGYKEKNFDQNVKQDWDSFAWDASITWQPIEHSKFLLRTGRSPAESTSDAALTVESDTSLQWTHEWMEDLFSTKVRANFGTSDYQQETINREDDRAGVSIGADYKFSRWGVVGVDYGYSERDSNLAANDYEQNLFMITVRTAM